MGAVSGNFPLEKASGGFEEYPIPGRSPACLDDGMAIFEKKAKR
jgi:hypothetical protein